MIYNNLGKTGLKVSAVGLGCEHLEGRSYEEIEPVVRAAIDSGINLFDVFMSEPNVRTHIGRAIGESRGQILLQGHIGATFVNGQYARSKDVDTCSHFVEDFLTRYQTDYIDIGMIHFVDNQKDFDAVFNGPLIEYVKELKRQGKIRFIGASSHNAPIALKMVETGLLDVLMFSLNAAYDLFILEDEPGLSAGIRFDPVRQELYKACKEKGVGITVMKSLAAGMLLSAEQSPFGKAMTVHQCLHYALTRPAVASVMLGCQTPEEVFAGAAYAKADDNEKDFSGIFASEPSSSLKGKCMYCNHCLPCPSSIEIAVMMKYMDIASTQDLSNPPPTVREHYNALSQTASTCIRCGSCEKNCPFGVPIMENMDKAVKVFGI